MQSSIDIKEGQYFLLSVWGLVATWNIVYSVHWRRTQSRIFRSKFRILKNTKLCFPRALLMRNKNRKDFFFCKKFHSIVLNLYNIYDLYSELDFRLISWECSLCAPQVKFNPVFRLCERQEHNGSANFKVKHANFELCTAVYVWRMYSHFKWKCTHHGH
jgi:hypothetical protein